MLATLTDKPFDDSNWLFEIKWDGYRAIAETGRGTRLYSRNGLDFQNAYMAIFRSLQKIKIPMILDGEIVVFNEKGIPDFQSLQQYPEHPGWPIGYYVFDILEYKGEDQKQKPLSERKALLKRILPKSDFIHYSDHMEGRGKAFFRSVQKKKMEGIIAKERNSTYTVGYRSRQWLKIKNQNTEEVVIAGYTQPRGSRKYFGALLLGRYRDGKLQYKGHSGTGFDRSTLKMLFEQMQPLIRDRCPFETIPRTNTPATWIQPRLVANIKFTELTADGIFRHPVFDGLRADKSAKEVTEKNDVMTIEKQNHTKSKVSAAGRTVTKKKAAAKKSNPKKDGVAGSIQKDADDREVKIGGKVLQLTNQSKVYWPEEGYTKADLIRYYQEMSTFILPYLKDRPESLHRFPNGIQRMSFYHKDAGSRAPAWVKRASIYSESTEKDIDYILCNDKATLAYLNNLGCIELNPWNSRVQAIDHPDYMVIDLDPGARNSFEDVIEAAQVTRQILDKCKADAYCKTSGSTGLHIYVPMKAKYHYDRVRDFAQIIASMVEDILPQTTTLERNLKKRGNKKIYLDYLQNRSGQTLASVYSVRPKLGATVSMPLEWKEVKPGLTPQDFDITNALKRVKRKGDIFKPVLGAGIDMRKCLKLLEGK